MSKRYDEYINKVTNKTIKGIKGMIFFNFRVLFIKINMWNMILILFYLLLNLFYKWNSLVNDFVFFKFTFFFKTKIILQWGYLFFIIFNLFF